MARTLTQPALNPRSARWPRALLLASGVAGVGALAAVNAALGSGLAGARAAVLAIGLLPLLAISLGALVASRRSALVFAALALTLASPVPYLTEPLPLPGGVSVFAADVLLLLALGAWVAARLLSAPREETRWPRTPVLGWPLLLLALALAAGVLRGHERYGESLVGQPLRLVLYAGIASALCALRPSGLYRGVVAIFYTGAVMQAAFGVYHLATGTSQTDQTALSTGGTRPLALGTAIYVSGALLLALLNLELDERAGRRGLHLSVAGIAAFGVAISFGRTNYAALGVLVPILLLALRRVRASALSLLPLVAPAVVLAALLVPRAAPSLAPTLHDRIVGTSGNDLNVLWRKKAAEVTLAGVDRELLRGVGFGRTSSFTLQGHEYTIRGDPHNSYLYLLAGGGVLAFASFLLLALVYLGDAWRRFRRSSGHARTLVLWAVSFWFVLMVNAFAGPVLNQPHFLLTIWILMLIPAAAVPLRKPGIEPTTEPGARRGLDPAGPLGRRGSSA